MKNLQIKTSEASKLNSRNSFSRVANTVPTGHVDTWPFYNIVCVSMFVSNKYFIILLSTLEVALSVKKVGDPCSRSTIALK